MNKNTIAAIALLLLGISGFSQSLTNGLIFYWPISNNADDFSGNALHGSSSGTFALDRNGNPGSAVSLNGVNQDVQFPSGALLQPSLPVTISIWVNFRTLGSVVFDNDVSPGNYSGVWMGTNSIGQIHLNYGDGNPVNPAYRRSILSGPSISSNSWHHLVGVIRNWNDMQIYIDCESVPISYSGNGGSLFYYNQGGKLGVGTIVGSGGVFHFDGLLDEIAFWSRDLSAGEVSKVCNGELDRLLITSNSQAIDNPHLSIFPNPASTYLMIDWPAHNITSLKLFDILGRPVIEVSNSSSGSQYRMDVSQLSSGEYFLISTDSEGNREVSKLLKE